LELGEYSCSGTWAAGPLETRDRAIQSRRSRKLAREKRIERVEGFRPQAFASLEMSRVAHLLRCCSLAAAALVWAGSAWCDPVTWHFTGTVELSTSPTVEAGQQVDILVTFDTDAPDATADSATEGTFGVRGAGVGMWLRVGTLTGRTQEVVETVVHVGGDARRDEVLFSNTPAWPFRAGFANVNTLAIRLDAAEGGVLQSKALVVSPPELARFRNRTFTLSLEPEQTPGGDLIEGTLSDVEEVAALPSGPQAKQATRDWLAAETPATP